MTATAMDEQTRLALVELMASRANIYRLLSRCYQSEVDAALAHELACDFSFESANDALTGGIDGMRHSLGDGDEAALEQLAVTFDRVFFGMGPLTARHAFPYESVYTSDRGIMMQQAYTQVVRIYREQALAKDASFTEPEDHVAVELAFMATLAERAGTFLSCGEGGEAADEAATETVRQSLEFLNNHLLNWTDRFCTELELAAATDGEDSFYVHLARFTAAFLHEDAAVLEEML